MADRADNRDSMSLPAILTQTMDNLQPHQIEVEEILADTGYRSGDVLRTPEFQKIKGYIPNFGQYKPEREGFIYDPENNRYICSQGALLPYKRKIKTTINQVISSIFGFFSALFSINLHSRSLFQLNYKLL